MKTFHVLGILTAASAGLFHFVMRTPAGEPGQDKFQPIVEAEMPAGFPPPTPVGQIEVKRYPAYRMARAESRSGESAFFSLFQHIKKNGIAMTAPVEMEYGPGKAGQPAERSMAFLYGKPTFGEPGADGTVQVVDVPEMAVVSLGARGAFDAKKIADAERLLQSWLSEHSDRYTVAGPLRVMGYNSPFVPRNRRYYEVQIPVEKPSGSQP